MDRDLRPRIPGRRKAVIGLATLLASPAVVRAQSRNGVALVIGNSKYHWESSLPNVRRDVQDVAKRFEQLGLKTELLQDIGRGTLQAALDSFSQATRGARFAAFYFAGHGVFWEGQSYIVPVDADLGNPGIASSLPSVPAVAEAMKHAESRLLTFDSCRNNPADGWKQRAARAMARGDAINAAASALRQSATLLLFSTAPGGTAVDGPSGDNSPFAASLLRQLSGQSVDLQSLPERLRRDLLLATECRQMVWDQNTFAAPVSIAGRSAASAPLRYDPSRVLELGGAYAAARENGLTLPAGLVAYRPAAGATEDSRLKIGSYQHDIVISGGGGYKAPSLSIVLSVPDAGSAEMMQSFRNFEKNVGGTRWRYITATNMDRAVTWLTIDESTRLELKWRDQRSGTFSTTPISGAAGGKIFSSPFSRLDG